MLALPARGENMLLVSTFVAFAAPAGEIYVTTSGSPLPIFLDGKPTGKQTPALLQGVEEGKHTVRLIEGCTGAEAPVDVAPGRVSRIELTPGVVSGMVKVQVEPKEAVATVLVDGRDDGAQVAAACGEHVVSVRAEGWTSAETRLVVPAFGEVEWAATLERLRYGTLVVVPTPLEARVSLDGKEVARGPVTLDRVVTGSHQLDVDLPGYVPSRSTLDLGADEVRRMDVVLAAVAPESTRVATARPKPKTGRVVLNAGVTAVGAVLAGVAVQQYAASQEAYGRFLDVPNDDIARMIWDEEVAPAQTGAAVAGVVSGLMLVGAGALWVTTF